MADVPELEAEQKTSHLCSTYEMKGAAADAHRDAPALPGAYLAIWGGQAAGISFAITQETFE